MSETSVCRAKQHWLHYSLIDPRGKLKPIAIVTGSKASFLILKEVVIFFPLQFPFDLKPHPHTSNLGLTGMVIWIGCRSPLLVGATPSVSYMPVKTTLSPSGSLHFSSSGTSTPPMEMFLQRTWVEHRRSELAQVSCSRLNQNRREETRRVWLRKTW